MGRFWGNRRDAVFDLVLVGVFTGIVVAIVLNETGLRYVDEPLWWLAVAFHLASVLVLIPRRKYPIAVGITATAAAVILLISALVLPGVLYDPKPGDVWMLLSSPVAAYTGVLYARNRVAAWTIVVVLAVVLARPWELNGEIVTAGLLFTVLPAVIAASRRSQKRLMRSLADRAERAERERHLLAEAARAEERTRLAGEVHDMVSHRVVLMVLHAEALGRATDDENARSTAATLADTGRQALGEMRELVGLLRGEPMNGDGSDPPGLDAIPTLISESESVGFPASLVEEGTPSVPSPVIDRTAYRIVQESLTNVRKHAAGASARVHVKHCDAQIRLTITNTRSTRPPTAIAGSGTGLLGLRQRAELVGGTLRAGPRPDGGFEVHAVLPAAVPTAETD